MSSATALAARHATRRTQPTSHRSRPSRSHDWTYGSLPYDAGHARSDADMHRRQGRIQRLRPTRSADKLCRLLKHVEEGSIFMRILVTGGAGFIGSALIRHLLDNTQHQVLNLDKLTYAGNLESLAGVAGNPRYQFLQADIGDSVAVSGALAEFQPDAIMHLAAESHVDRSIDGPAAFIQTNIVGTYALLEATRAYWLQL